MQHKLLIVDDEPRIYHALRRALHREQGWETVYAESGEAALEILDSQAIDVIVSDENMPGMTGTQLLGLVRQRHADVIRMMLTGDARIDVVMKAVNAGEIYRFFTKPCNEAELIIAIRDALQMRKLKAESRRLLDMVKKQQARIRMLEGQGSPLACAETADEVPLEGGAMSLDALARKGASAAALSPAPVESDQPSSADPPAEPDAAESPAAVTDSVIDLSNERGDVDTLLDDIRTELDDILR